MKRTLTFLFALLLLASLCACGVAPVEPETSTAAQASKSLDLYDFLSGEKYEQLTAPAQDYLEVIERFRAVDSMFYAIYALYDMDGDNQPELLIELIPFHMAGGYWYVYTMQDEEALFIGGFNGRQSMLYTCDEGGLTRVWGPTLSGGREEVYRYTKQGERLIETTIIEARVIGENGYYVPPDSVQLETKGIEHFDMH
ncbi:MAG: hypothetical protein FWE98_03440 [Oscillospiraceae bacterium]|nr:hypothetical protein [Oscillospiraceae bacterium]